MGGQHLEAEGAGDVGHDRPSVGRDAVGDLLDHRVGRGQEHQIDAGDGPDRVVGGAEKLGHLPPDRGEGGGERRPGPARPDDPDDGTGRIGHLRGQPPAGRRTRRPTTRPRRQVRDPAAGP